MKLPILPLKSDKQARERYLVAIRRLIEKHGLAAVARAIIERRTDGLDTVRREDA